MTDMEIFEIKDEKQFSDAMSIYNEAFPPAERRPESELRKNLIKYNEKMFMAEEDGIPIIFTILWKVPGTDFLFLDYIAVKKEYRGRGSGSEFLKLLIDMDSIEFNHIILEVENPASGENIEQRQKRIRFYRKAGARIIKGFKYYLPPRNGVEPQEMLLMVISKKNIKRISGKKMEQVLSLIYTHVYHKSEDDNTLQNVIKGIPDEVTLE